MAIEYTPESSLVADPAEGGSFSASNDAELAGAQSFAAQAKLSETAAATSETNSANSATASAGSATAASGSATQSADSATASATSATQSATSATASATSATASANSATAAATSETNAGTSATTATTKALEASTSATNAATSETNAGTSATAASNSATAASTSATSASGSATTATTKASEASTSETNAGTSATASATSATASANSATAAATSATNAGTSETAAATSATNAATSATSSANSATASAGSATNSANSATSAGTAQTAAEAARDAALAAFDSFDDRYLGQKTSDPSTDNDGNALVAGTLYFNTSTDSMMVYEGSSWVAAYASLSGALIANNNLSDLNNAATARTNLGLGTIATAASTDYVPTTGGTFTGNVESTEFIGTLQGEVVFKAKAGEAITKGDAVYVSGISGNTPVVSKADADDSAKMPAFGLSADTVSTNAAMEVVILGQLTNIDTSSYTLGDTLYISSTPGVLSATKPAGESSQLQNIGKVERVHASTGSILVSGSGRSAATPNLNDGQFFLGNGSNQSVSTDFTTSVLGEISAGTGIGISGGGVISNSAPDQTVALTGAGATSVSGTYPNFTITSTDTDTNTTYTAGTGITLTGTQFSLTDTNAKLNLTGGTITSGGNIGLKVSHDDFQEGIISYRNHASNSASYVFENASGRTGTLYTQNDFPMWRDGTTSNSHKVWTQGNDGSGSGLDADTVDGLQASAFAQKTGAIFTGNVTIDQGTSGDAILTLRADTDNNDEGDHPSIRMKQDGDLVDWRIGIGSSDGDIGTHNNDLCFSHNAGSTNGIKYVTSSGAVHSLWHSGNDGSGSGLDADTVDGLTSGSFLRSDVTDYVNGVLLLREDIRNEDAYRDHGVYGHYVSSKTNHIWSMGSSYRSSASGANFGTLYGFGYKHTNNSTGGTMAGSHQAVWCHNGTPKAAMGTNIWTSGNVTAYSDIRVKENIEVIPNALDKVCQLGGYTFNRTDVTFDEHGEAETPIRQTGVIAQEVLEVLPEAVTGDEEGHYSVAYGNMVGLLIESIKELKAEVDNLKAQLEDK